MSLPKVEIVPATREDYEAAMVALHGAPSGAPTRVIGFAGKIDGRVIGVGGVAFYPSGVRIAFCEVGDEARKYKISLHRAALMTIEKAKAMGVRRIVVTEERMHEKTPHWLLRLGFTKMTVKEVSFYVRSLA